MIDERRGIGGSFAANERTVKRMSNSPKTMVMLETAVDRYSAMLYCHSYMLLGQEQDAQDVVQETFLRYWRKSPDFERDEHEKAWLLRVSTNLCKNVYRSRSRHPQVPLEQLPEQAAPEASSLPEALRLLPDMYKSVLMLHYIHGYKVREIAAMEHLTQSTVKMRLRKGRQLLEKLYKEEQL